MLVKNGFEGIAHFVNHPEMLPHKGVEILFVGECVNLPDGKFEDKAESFKTWYDTPTPKIIDGITEEDWRMARVYFDVRQTVHRNYDKYARPQSPRLLEEITKLYAEIADKTLKRHLDEYYMYSCDRCDMGHMDIIYARSALNYDMRQDYRERFLNCSYCTYFQRPNLTAGGFKEIMPDEDKYAFEIFRDVLEVIKPRLVIILSAKASEAIKRYSARKLPYKILYFDSEYPSKWDAKERQRFRNAVRTIFTEKVKNHLKHWLRATGVVDKYFTSAIDELLLGKQFENHKSLEGLDELIATNARELIAKNPSGKAWFNCYPLDVHTDKVFSLFLAICRGDEKLDGVFDKVLEQAQKIIDAYPEGKLVKRNIVLLTDKWDKNTFNSYRNKFSKYKPLIYFIFGWIKESKIQTVGSK